MKPKMTKNPEWKEIILDALMKEQVSSNDLEETEMEDTQRGKEGRPPQLSGSVCTQHTTALGSNPKAQYLLFLQFRYI